MGAGEGGPALLAGLGNPGREYRRNRHNVGFMALAEIARRAGADLRTHRFHGLLGQGRFGGRPVILVQPETFMNLSGECVGAAARFFRVPAEDLCALHDDVDLPFGRLQVKAGGGHGGHNGVRSVIEHLGSNAFRRIRIGVGRPPDSRIPTADYVLSDFYPEEARVLEEVLWRVADAVEVWLREGVQAAMNRFNGRAPEALKERPGP
jgi:PTH1 family peptidyl-tRNA hydrolase